jgi:hypothetical protein
MDADKTPPSPIDLSIEAAMELEEMMQRVREGRAGFNRVASLYAHTPASVSW